MGLVEDHSATSSPEAPSPTEPATPTGHRGTAVLMLIPHNVVWRLSLDWPLALAGAVYFFAYVLVLAALMAEQVRARSRAGTAMLA